MEADGGLQAASPKTETLADVLPRSARLLEYLEAVLALRERPIRNLEQYGDKVWRISELPNDRACKLRREEDVWLRVSKVIPPPPPQPPADLLQWLEPRSIRDPDLAPTLRERVVPEGQVWSSQEIAAEGVEDAIEHAHRQAALSGWIVTTWEPWADRTRTVRGVRRLYQDLYDTFLRLQREEAALEIVWGQGIVSWQLRRESVQHPLVTTRMTVAFDEASGDLVVAPDEASQLEIDYLQGLDIGGLQYLVDLRRRFEEEPSDMWDAPESERLFEDFVTRLPVPGVILDASESPPTPATPSVIRQDVLFIRRRKVMYKAFLSELRERLDASHGNGLTGPLASVVSESPSSLALPGDDAQSSEWDPVGTELLLPLPTNAEQEQIVSRLANHRGVTVQGPPGTGKTHTIANLICHLVAHGKRVLVTSQKEQPLAVLREKIPPEVRDLTVSVLGASRHSQAQLEQSVQAIYSNAIGLDSASEDRRIEELRSELSDARTEVARLRANLRTAREAEGQEYVMGEESLTPSQVGRWLSDHAPTVGFIKDRISPGTAMPLSVAEVADFSNLAGNLSPADRDACQSTLPSRSLLPSGRELANRRSRRTEIQNDLDELPLTSDASDLIQGRGVEELRAVAEGLSQAAQALKPLEVAWLARVRAEVDPSSMWRPAWLELVGLARAGLEAIAVWRRDVAGHRIQLGSSGVPTQTMVSSLGELSKRRSDGKSVSKILHRRLYEIAHTSMVDGEPLTSVEAINLALIECRLRRRRHEVLIRFNDAVGRVGGPQIAEGVEPEFELDVHLRSIEQAIAWVDGLGELSATLDQFFEVRTELQSTSLTEWSEVLTRAEKLFELEEIDKWTAPDPLTGTGEGITTLT